MVNAKVTASPTTMWLSVAKRTARVCSVPGCPNLTASGGRCHEHRRAADRARGDRGYSTPGHKRFRRIVLRRDPICVVCGVAPSAVADHHPMSRKDLIAAGRNPDDPRAGRGVCKPCHDRETAKNQPGGWNDPGWSG